MSPLNVELLVLPESHGLTAARPAHETRAEPAQRITWLVDNADAYRALLAACRAAQTSIWLTQLAFDADCVAYLPEDTGAEEGESAEMRIADVLEERARAGGVAVRVLLNASLLLDTAAALRCHFAARGVEAQRLRIRGIDRFPQLLHAKLVIVDGTTAFLVGSPFANGYWDDCQHLPVDARRPARELGGRPLHDLSVELRGPSVAALAEGFAELWNGADDLEPDDDERLEAPLAPGDDRVRIVRSAPRPALAGQPVERREILPALLQGIASAERLIYIEHQYLSAIPVIDALVAVLARRPALEVIVLVNQNPDVTAYRGWQNRRLKASGLFVHPRVGIFSPWTLASGAPAVRAVASQIFIHSKVVVVDDRWAMVGSANLDGVSLTTYGEDFSGRLGQRVFRGVRNFDVAAVLTADPAEAASPTITELRTALWREHLDAPDLDATAVPEGGWLLHWRTRAARNVATLHACTEVGGPHDRGTEPALLVLPYSRASTPERQLRTLGVPFASERLRLSFRPSWIEVHFSPNWLRNVFA